MSPNNFAKILFILSATIIFLTGCSTYKVRQGLNEPIKNALQFKVKPPVWDLIVNDFDMDGNLDFAALSKYEQITFVFNFSNKTPYIKNMKLNARHPIDMCLGDFNNDGFKDLALLGEWGFYSIVSIKSKYEINEHLVKCLGHGRMWSINKVNLDNDVDQDLVGGGAGLVLYINGDNFTFSSKEYRIRPPKVFSKKIEMDAIYSIEPVPDLNNDNRPEILMTDYFTPSIWTAWSVGKKGFNLKKNLAFTNRAPIFAKYLGIDSNKEPIWIVVTDTPPGKLTIFNGLEKWRKIKEWSVDGRISKVISRDIDGDGLDDIIVFVENKVPSKPGALYFFRSIYKNGHFSLEPSGKIKTGIFTSIAMDYKCPYLGIADYKSGKVEVYRIGRHFRRD